jgi:hypothetical protein
MWTNNTRFNGRIFLKVCCCTTHYKMVCCMSLLAAWVYCQKSLRAIWQLPSRRLLDVFWIICNASQLQLSNEIFSDVLGRILRGSPFTTIIVNLNPQGGHAKRRAMVLLGFQRRACSEFGRHSFISWRSQSPKLFCKLPHELSGVLYETMYVSL